MPSGWSYTVTHYSKSGAWSSTDVTDDVVAIPSFTDTGTEEFNTAMLKLVASRGKYITNTKIVRDDRIRIQADDGLGGTYNKVFDVRKTIPIKSKGEGTVLQLNLRGIEAAMDEINFSKRIDFDFPKNAITDIVTNYNLNRGTDNPICGTNIVIPTSTKNTFEFGTNEEKSYTRILEVLDSLGGAVDDAGLLDFYEANFTHNTGNVTGMTLNVFSSGGTDSGVTITNSQNVNVGESEGGIESSEGTVLNAWASPDVGSLPVDVSKFSSAELRFNQYPQWISGVSYKSGAKVRHNGTVYQSNINNNTSTPPTNWTARTAGQDYGEVIQYSPWTVGKANLWKAAGCDLGLHTGDMGNGMWDSNLVIWDTANNSFQTWADVRSTSTGFNFNTRFIYDGGSQTTGFYEGFRILVDGTATGNLAGSDSNNRSRNNAIVEYTKKDDGTFEWRVKYQATTNLRCAVISEGRIWRYNGASWADDSSNTKHCWHPYDSVTNVTSIITGTSFTLNNNSAIRFRYRFNLPALLITPSEYQRAGAWACFRFPFPHNTAFAMSETVGELYGGTLDSKVPFLDAQNMNYTHDGLTGFNRGASSEDLGPINAIAFWCKLGFFTDATGLGGYTTKVADGNFNMRAAFYDRNDNVAVQDFVLLFNDTPQEVKLPLGSFQIYRAIKSIDSITDGIVPPKQLDAQNQFEWRHIKQVVIQTQDSYDKEGRFLTSAAAYVPLISEQNRFYKGVLPDGNVHPFRQIDLIIDTFRFVKPLLVNSGQELTYVREPDFISKPDIVDYYQLKSIVSAELEKARFEKAKFDITTSGAFDISHGESFYYTDSEIIDYSDNGANTVKLVAKKINYSITKPKNGEGGFLRTITGSRRFT